MIQHLPPASAEQLGEDNIEETELTDADILDAMQHIPGYLDISTEDFRTIYHLAHLHAVKRMFAGVTARRLMRTAIVPLQPNITLDQAAKHLADSGYKGLPVVDGNGYVIGMLTETDFMKHLKSDNFMSLLLNLLDNSYEFTHTYHETTVNEAMTKPAVTIDPEAGFMDIMEAFHQHAGRSMPVVGADGQVLGLLLRKDFFAAYKMDKLA